MVLILSDENDQSTNGVIDWLNHYGVPHVRINFTDKISDVSIDSEFNVTFNHAGKRIDLSKLTSYWYRRGSINLSLPDITNAQIPFINEIKRHIISEGKVLSNYILSSLKKLKSIGDYFNSDPNKFLVLSRAKARGLEVPETLVTSRKDDVLAFMTKHTSTIVKCNGDMLILNMGDNSLYSYTKRLDKNIIDGLSESFAPTCFQEEIEKEFELRIFYINESFYSMAIFSQLDETTEVDFRNYNKKRPNRRVPFKIPNCLKDKLNTLMKDLHYETGSIDMLYSKDKRYVFLEINPIGQYEMVSFPCNYNLHKVIAENLISYDPRRTS